MKIIFTKIALSFSAMFILMASNSNAATITATVSGNWSNATTWSGGVAGGTISGIDNVVIPAGITVTLDMDVQVTSVLGSISVSGDLNSINNKKLMINQGSLSGNGDMNLYYLELGTIGGMSFTGDLTVNHFITSNASLNLGAQVTLIDTLCLKAGSLTLGSGSLLSLNTNSNIKVENGSLAIGGGVFTATNDYDVIYFGNSKTTGIELDGSGLKHLYVQLTSATQILTLGINSIVNGVLHHDMGTLMLNGKKLTLMGDYIRSSGSTISGTATSTLSIQTITSPSMLMFTPGSGVLGELWIDTYNLGTATVLGSDLSISGQLYLSTSLEIAASSTLTMNAGSDIVVEFGDLILTGGSFNGSASYDVKYIARSKMTSAELIGTGLNNVDIDLTYATDSVKMSSIAIVNGTLSLNNGSLNISNYSLELKGNLNSELTGWLQGNSNSDLIINTIGSVSDTLKFANGWNMLHNFTVNTANGSSVMLDNDLTVENIILTNGGVTIYDNDITINSTGTITGFSMNNYIMIKGDGRLMMNVNTSSPYVMFPVGTVSGYAPAHIQRTSGTSAVLGVNTYDGVWGMGVNGSGSNMASSLSVVDRTWDISSASTSSVNMNVKFEWATAMEANGFNRNNTYVSKYTTNWDNIAPSTATTTGIGVYQLARNGITSTGQFVVADNLSALSVKEQEEITFSLYPNPAHNHLTVLVKDNEGFSVEVFDALGNKAVSEKTIKGSSTDVDFSSLSAGVYFVKISNDTTQSVRRVVKQ